MAQYTTQVGLGPKSVSSRLFITAPSSAPESLTLTDVTTNSFFVSWDPPAHRGDGIQEEDLIYNVQLTGGLLKEVPALLFSINFQEKMAM